jgi:2-oxoglutarate/2-oxoacid ferredoxin oxidoreductase subunit alpha
MPKKVKKAKKETLERKTPSGLTIVLAGEAGQGVQSIETILVSVLKKDGFNVFATKEYMSRVRGGVNSTEIRLSDSPVRSHAGRIDILIALNDECIPHLKGRISPGTVVLGDSTQVHYDRLTNIPFQRIASEFGNALFSNTVAVGTVCGMLGVNEEILYADVRSKFLAKGEDIAAKNVEASKSGYNVGKEMKNNGIIKKEPSISSHLMLNGADAVALGALAGGCNACFAYPMTPSTGVFTALAGYSKTLDIVVEQVEDEIGVMNMSLGAWYAGARSIVSTSGGGFALMTEAVSLAGMIESPAVIHLAQRPGPATGLPTRTEQGDLNLALYAGHGYFPRIILAPGSTEEAFYLSQKAFNLADEFQVPVFIMTDQYFVDSYYNIPAIVTAGIKVEKHITGTTAGYKRYAFTKNGISPRGIPGFGAGLVAVDSDEHDEEARITEDLDGIRMLMADKRMKKMRAVKKAAIKPVLFGPKKYKNLIVSWGSNYNTIIEALAIINDRNTAFLHFPQIFPLHESAEKFIRKAKNVIAIENNETGQFADLIKLETGVDIKNRILKYNGMPFSVEELVLKIKSLI